MTVSSAPTVSEPPFSRVGIAGLGLIGASIALGVQHIWPGATVTGFDRPDATAEARRRQIVHKTVDDLEALAGNDLIVLAVPLAVMIEWMPRLLCLETGAVVTDVGSTKRQVMAAAARLPSFVGGHPMGGSEQGGLEHARADLFVSRPWLLVKGTGDDRASRRVEHFAAGLGAWPHWIDAETHDRAIAYISHLPQVMAVALMNAATEAVGERTIAATMGRAFPEMTRLASSPPDLWQGILEKNADFVAEAIARFVGKLPAGTDLKGDAWVRDVFGRAAASRARLSDSGKPTA